MRIAQIVVSILLIALVLIQERSSGLSGVFGGGGGAPYQTRRGMEKFVYWTTIGVGIAFIAIAVLNLVL